MIKVTDMLAKMEQTDRKGNYLPFSLQFVTADISRRTGGEVIRYPEAVLARAKRQRKWTKDVGRPARLFNRARNITAPGSGQIRKIHIDLVTHFNGEVVV